MPPQVHSCPPSAIGPFVLLLSVLEQSASTCLFSEVTSRLSSSDVPSHDFHRNICSPCAVRSDTGNFRTLEPFFLLSYLLTHSLYNSNFRPFLNLLPISKPGQDRYALRWTDNKEGLHQKEPSVRNG